MSECAAGYCGIGTRTTLPGDPDNNISISATGQYGSVRVQWTSPGTNDHAIAYTIIYRASVNLFGTALEIGRTRGNAFVDYMDNDTTYYFYWVRNVSINGTTMDVIGPAAASARPSIEKLMQDLTGQIDSGLLAQDLKGDIDRIYDLQDEILAERANRIAANGVIENALSGLRFDVTGLDTAIHNETVQRNNANEAIAAAMNLLYAAKEENNALILQEQVARATADDALAETISTVQAQSEDNAAAITDAATAYANDKLALAEQLNTMVATSFKVYRSPTEPAESTDVQFNVNDMWIDISAVSAEDLSPKNHQYFWDGSSWVRGEDSGIRGAMAAINTESIARANALGALTQTVTDYTSSNDTALSAVTTSVATAVGDISDLTTNVDGIATDILGLEDFVGSKYSVVLTSVNDPETGNPSHVIGGFGLYNNTTSVEAGFDVDKFWVGRTDGKGTKPFIINEGKVYIDEALINKLVFSKLTADDGSLIVENGKIKADFLEAGDIDVSGFLTLTDANTRYAGKTTVDDLATAVDGKLSDTGTFKGTLAINTTVTKKNTMVLNNQSLKVYDSSGNLRVHLGNLLDL